MTAIPNTSVSDLRTRFPSVEDMLRALTPSYPVYCVHGERLVAAADEFVTGFPGTVMYAVKCNPSQLVLDMLHAGGIRDYDTASLPEIAAVHERFPESRCYFQHPVKSRAAIETAYSVYEVRDFAIDHPAELAKLRTVAGADPNLTVFVRLATEPGHADYDLSSKFGADHELAAELLRMVRHLGYRPAVSFHVGSQCLSPDAYGEAIRDAGIVIAEADVSVSALDIGGGFPAPYPNRPAPPLQTFFSTIGDSFAALELDSDVALLCEPGRSLVADGVSVITQVQLRKDDHLYINDGVFGSFSELLFVSYDFPAQLHRLEGDVTDECAPFIVYGPTCDSNDLLPTAFELPADVREGDWIEFSLMGAYSNALRTGFNGFYPETFVLVDAPGVS